VKVVRLSPEAIDELVERPNGTKPAGQGWSQSSLQRSIAFLRPIASSPKAFPRLLDLPADLEIRRALLPRFPYGLIFMDLGEHIRVLAVAHAKRQPRYWLDRVGDE
jgi:hypothetical protein